MWIWLQSSSGRRQAGQRATCTRDLGWRRSLWASSCVRPSTYIQARRCLTWPAEPGTLPAARRDAEVTGLDIVPGGLEHARRRFEVEGLSGTFLEGEAENLPFPDDNFDIVLSTFGVMFAPNVDKAASELLRVCRSGGRIGLANWIPEGAGGELMKVMGAYMPPMPPGVRSPFEWGTEKRLRELFGNDINALVATRRTLAWRAGTPEALLQGLRTHNGPFRMFFEALPPERAEACARDLLAMWGRYNQASDGTAQVPQDYLEVVANRS